MRITKNITLAKAINDNLAKVLNAISWTFVSQKPLHFVTDFKKIRLIQFFVTDEFLYRRNRSHHTEGLWSDDLIGVIKPC